MMNRYPIYIVSKGRSTNAITATALEESGVEDYFIITEKDEVDLYRAAYPKSTVLELPQKYLDDYDTFDDLGFTKSKGPGAARNFAWDHSTKNGFAWHWVMDDNFEHFYRLNRNLISPTRTPAIFEAAEDFVDRYENLHIAGFNYNSFCPCNEPHKPFLLNTRIYSCLLIRNDIPYRWRGRYNEDTDLSLRVLKDGFCTLQFNAFLCGKVTTQRMRGGNSKEFYDHEGTLAKSRMLTEMHPDVSKLTWRFNRWHHHVDYKGFKRNKLIRKDSFVSKEIVNEYGMVLKTYDK